jgi:purine-nucleoside phosphorylase
MSLHINAQPGAIAPIVLMPGDPLRAKHIATQMLINPRLVSDTRNIYFYTGNYEGEEISIGASGMGCPSIGIYSYELFDQFEVKCIIRIGTCGAYTSDSNLYDVINVNKAYSESTYALEAFGYEDEFMSHQGMAHDCIIETASSLDAPVISAPIHTSDVFYRSTKGIPALALKNRCTAVEMEAFALFANARYHGKMAATLLTITDIIPTGERLTPDQRQNTLNSMTHLALESAVALYHRW